MSKAAPLDFSLKSFRVEYAWDLRFPIIDSESAEKNFSIVFIKKTMEDKIFHLFRTRSNEEVDLDNFLTIRFRFNEEKIFLPQRWSIENKFRSDAS